MKEDKIIDTGIQIEYKSEVMAYSELFNFFNQEHGLILLNSEMDDIVKAVDCFKNQFNGKEKSTDSSTNSSIPY